MTSVLFHALSLSPSWLERYGTRLSAPLLDLVIAAGLLNSNRPAYDDQYAAALDRVLASELEIERAASTLGSGTHQSPPWLDIALFWSASRTIADDRRSGFTDRLPKALQERTRRFEAIERSLDLDATVAALDRTQADAPPPEGAVGALALVLVLMDLGRPISPGLRAAVLRRLDPFSDFLEVYLAACCARAWGAEHSGELTPAQYVCVMLLDNFFDPEARRWG